MPTFLTFELTNLDYPLFYETSLVRIRIVINKIINKNRAKKEPCNKNILGGKAICYNKETLFCLISETTVLNLWINNTSVNFLII